MKSIAALVLVSAALVGGCSSNHSLPTAVTPPADTTASYTVTFRGTWSAATHPVGFPLGAHFSGLIGATHSNSVAFWQAGQLASTGIQDMAELGSKASLHDEIATAMAAGTSQYEVSGDGISPSPGEVALDFDIAASHPLITLVSMIAPSPDWFVGVAGLPLHTNGAWVDSLTVELRGWDAGTDDGATYGALNAPAMPHVPIAALGGTLFEVNGEIPPLGTFTFVRHR